MTGADRRLINKDGPRLPEYLETSCETTPGLPAERTHEIFVVTPLGSNVTSQLVTPRQIGYPDLLTH